MPVASARWRNPDHPGEVAGFDVHVVADLGPSQALSDLLWLETSPGGGVTATEANAATTTPKISVRFLPEFNAVDLAAADIKHASNHVSVNASSGVVTFAPKNKPVPAHLLHNFVIRAHVVDETGTRLPNPPGIRIHLHPLIPRVWLTPSILTAHKSAGGNDTPVRFRVLAEFGDDTSGDLTNHAGIVWDTTDIKVLVRRATGEFWPGGSATGDVPIKATLPASLGGSTIQGTIRVSDPLSKSIPVRPVGRTTAALPRSNQLNVLFLSEGYLAGQQPLFDAAVVAAIQATESRRAFPLNRLNGSVAFWSAFVPSREAGSTILYETFHHPQDPWYEVIDPPTLPGTHVPSLNAVLARTLPVPADQATTLAAQLVRWANLYGIFGAFLSTVDADVHKGWQAIGDRFLIDNRDTAFGLTFGERPRVERPLDVPRGISMSPLRMTRVGGLNLLLDNLSPRGNWGTPGSSSYSFVVFLCAGSRRGGARDPNTETLAFSVHEVSEIQAQVQGFSHQAVLVPYAPTTTIGIDIASTMVHELAHALGLPGVYKYGLNDEYGAGTAANASISAADEDSIARYANTQTAKSVQGSGTTLDGDNIKWGKWHRIVKAAVITTDTPLIATGPFQLGHEGTQKGEEFRKDELVRLRFRPLAQAGAASEPLRIVKVDSPTQITVTPVSGSISLAGRSRGGIVFVPRRRGNTELMLMSEAVRNQITATNRPLNARRPPAAYACAVSNSEPQDPLNLPTSAAFKKPRYAQWIVGIYDGGSSFSCGVYHPTGSCVMRRKTRAYLGEERNAMYAFCPVCRYVLIDNLDPKMHGTADLAYQSVWPEPP